MTDEITHEDGKAFAVVRQNQKTTVEHLRLNQPLSFGNQADCQIILEGTKISPHEFSLKWDGQNVFFEAQSSFVFVNGKPAEPRSKLNPGDEISVADVQVVIGIAQPRFRGGRRSLSHTEFRERLYEEMARAARGSRPTTLIMVKSPPNSGAQITSIALDAFRAGDVVGTYAPDELEILLPDLGEAQAKGVINRVLNPKGNQLHIGYAVSPIDGDNPERLMRKARFRLIQSMDPKHKEPTALHTDISTVTEHHDKITAELIAELKKAAKQDSPLLLTGEWSSGKSVFAKYIHAESTRKQKPFNIVHCASIFNEINELDNFANQGAQIQSLLTETSGGTILLDEIGDLSPTGQKVLSEILMEHQDEVRVISTTHRTLAGLVERNAFDKELYAQINGEQFEIPPLRNRPDDIIPLATKFAQEFGAKQTNLFSTGSIARLRSYPWPGNILELCNAIERAVHLAGDSEILAEHLPIESPAIAFGEGRLREHVDSVERDAIITALADNNYNQTRAAQRLGISRRALIYKMEKYGLKPPPGTKKRETKKK